MKVVINRCHGGFGLSQKAISLIRETHPHLVDTYTDFPWDTDQGIRSSVGVTKLTLTESNSILLRTMPRLIEILEDIGREAWDEHSDLTIVDVKEKYWHIVEYDGYESITASDSPIVRYTG